MIKFRSLKMATKSLVIVIPFFLLFAFTSSFVINVALSSFAEADMMFHIMDKSVLVSNLLDELQDKALQSASVFARMDVVKTAYSMEDDIAGRSYLAEHITRLFPV